MKTEVLLVDDYNVIIAVANFEIKFTKINGKVKKTTVIQHDKTRMTDGFIPKVYFDPAIKRARAIFCDRDRRK